MIRQLLDKRIGRLAALTAGAALSLASLGATRAVAADNPAKVVPADARVYVQVNDLAKIRADWENDPLAQYLEKQMPPHHEPKAWADIQQMMGMSGPQIVDTYFGKVLSMFAEGEGHRPPGMVLSQVDKADAEKAVQKLGLQSMGAFGKFELYQPSDGKGRIAFGGGWMAMGDAKDDQFIRKTLPELGKGHTLADDDQFKMWTSKLPGDWAAMAFLRDPDHGEVHVVNAQRGDHRDVTINYAGHSPKFAKLFEKLGDAKPLDFGPLPQQTIAAATLNLHDNTPDSRAVQFFDRIIAPHTYDKDLLPAIDAPVVAFLGELHADQVEPNPGLSVPVIGWAIHLKGDAAVGDLNKMINTGLLFANMATLRMQVDPIEMGSGQYEGCSYQTANIGKPLSEKAKRPEAAGVLKLTYGQIGDWYVICTQEKFFRMCVDAAKGKAPKVTSEADFKAIPLKDRDQPIVSGFLRAPMLADHLRTWLAYGRTHYPEVFAEADKRPGADADDHHEGGPRRWREHRAVEMVRGLTVLAGALDHYRSFSMQAYREGGDSIGAQVFIRRDPADSK